MSKKFRSILQRLRKYQLSIPCIFYEFNNLSAYLELWLNLSIFSTDFASATNKNPNLLSTYPPRRTSNSTSEDRSQTRYSEMGRGQKVVLLQSEVFGVTDDECQQALRTNNWDVTKSIKYLKVNEMFAFTLPVSLQLSEQQFRLLEK